MLSVIQTIITEHKILWWPRMPKISSCNSFRAFSNFYNFFFHLPQNEYTDWERPPRSQQLGARDAALELLSDGHTVAPLVRLAYLHSLRGGKSYFMHFNHRTSERDFPQVRIFSIISSLMTLWIIMRKEEEEKVGYFLKWGLLKSFVNKIL